MKLQTMALGTGLAYGAGGLMFLNGARKVDQDDPLRQPLTFIAIGCLTMSVGLLMVSRIEDTEALPPGDTGHDDPIGPFDPEVDGVELDLPVEKVIEETEAITDEALSQVMGIAERELAYDD